MCFVYDLCIIFVCVPLPLVNLLRVTCVCVLRMVCVSFFFIFPIHFSVNLWCVFSAFAVCVFLCELRMVGV